MKSASTRPVPIGTVSTASRSRRYSSAFSTSWRSDLRPLSRWDVSKLSAYVLTFNEPDMISAWGGSEIAVATAVSLFKQYVQPLAAKGYKLGAPAVSASAQGTQWIQDFVNQCTGCTID